MKERPILFSGPMVRALLDGSKTQTRRVVKCDFHSMEERDDGKLWPWREDLDRAEDHWYACPYGQPGDHLWVRETHSFVPDDEEPAGCSQVLYAADGNQYGKLRPSIHMPRWACRILLEIVSVRVERLQDISEDDAAAEGIPRDTGIGTQFCRADARNGYRHLWEQINGPGSWEANPWVWVIEFKPITPAPNGAAANPASVQREKDGGSDA